MLKRFWILCLIVLMLSGCTNGGKEVKRAVFAWQGVEDTDLKLLEKYKIDTIFMDMNHFSKVPGYNIFLLVGDPSWGLKDMEKMVKKAEAKKVDGILFDIENDYEALAENLGKLKAACPVYVCIPYWLEEDIQEEIIKATDGVVVMNYFKGKERQHMEEEMMMADEYGKKLITAYELQPVGKYDLKEANTYNSDGLAAVEDNYKQQFSGTNVGIAFHNLKMMRELDEMSFDYNDTNKKK